MLDSLANTLYREAWEEAGLSVNKPLKHNGYWEVFTPMPYGLQHEHVFVYDAWLPQRFKPQNQDGEVCETQLFPVNEVIERILKHEFTVDAALVIVDGLCRLRFFGLESLSIYQLVTNHLREVKQRFIAASPPLI